jgi:hypothetical protein
MATQIVFLGSSKDQPLAVVVDQDAKTVGQMVRDARELAQLTRDGEPIWVNLSTALYVEERREPEASYAFI